MTDGHGEFGGFKTIDAGVYLRSVAEIGALNEVVLRDRGEPAKPEAEGRAKPKSKPKGKPVAEPASYQLALPESRS